MGKADVSRDKIIPSGSLSLSINTALTTIPQQLSHHLFQIEPPLTKIFANFSCPSAAEVDLPICRIASFWFVGIRIGIVVEQSRQQYNIPSLPVTPIKRPPPTITTIAQLQFQPVENLLTITFTDPSEVYLQDVNHKYSQVLHPELWRPLPRLHNHNNHQPSICQRSPS